MRATKPGGQRVRRPSIRPPGEPGRLLVRLVTRLVIAQATSGAVLTTPQSATILGPFAATSSAFASATLNSPVYPSVTSYIDGGLPTMGLVTVGLGDAAGDTCGGQILG